MFIMTSKKLETCEYIYLHLHNFYTFLMGYFVLCVPHPLFLVSSISSHSIISFFLNCTCFVPKLLESVAISVCFFFKANSRIIVQHVKREDRDKRNREKE